MKITTKQVGARMREARKKKKYTLRYLANKIGLSSGSTISNWELGLNLPNKRYLKKSLKPAIQQYIGYFMVISIDLCASY